MYFQALVLRSDLSKTSTLLSCNIAFTPPHLFILFLALRVGPVVRLLLGQAEVVCFQSGLRVLCMHSSGGCAQPAACRPLDHPDWRTSCRSPSRHHAASLNATQATSFGSFVPAWKSSTTALDVGRPFVPSLTRNLSIACGLVASGAGLSRAIAGEHASFTLSLLRNFTTRTVQHSTSA